MTRSSGATGPDPGGRPRYYVGLATTFHDPAVAIVGPDGDPLFAEATERFLQYKRALNCEPDSIPRMAELLADHVPGDAEVCVATSWSARVTAELARRSEAGLFGLEPAAALPTARTSALVPASTERAYAGALHLRQSGAGLGLAIGLERAYGHVRVTGLRRYRHHDTHAALAAFGSPFERAACLVVDGMAEAGAVSLYHYTDGRLERMPGGFGSVSPGLLYSLLTDECGFDSLVGEEWKVMGLAPYGDTRADLLETVRQLYRTDERGRPVRVPAETVAAVLRRLRAHRPSRGMSDGWADLASATQAAFGELMDYVVGEARRRLPVADLVLTGGCALNSSYNRQVVNRHGYERLHVPSAPADDGNALGAALLAWAEDHPGRRPGSWRRPLTPYLGSVMSTRPLERLRTHEPRLVQAGEDIVERTARLLAEGLLVGWVQGRAEFGPRALGNRSILADPRRPEARDDLNERVKRREAFRPFAPAILAEHGPEWFEDFQPSPYMERTLVWRPEVRHRVPAVVHVDGTGRLQTVTAAANPRFHRLLTAFHRLTGVPVLLNTSLNVMGRPIAHATEDALTVFYTTGLDALIVGDWMVTKSMKM